MIAECEKNLKEIFDYYYDIALFNTKNVLKAFARLMVRKLSLEEIEVLSVIMLDTVMKTKYGKDYREKER